MVTQEEAFAARTKAAKERQEANEARLKAEERRALYEISNCIEKSETAKQIARRHVLSSVLKLCVRSSIVLRRLRSRIRSQEGDATTRSQSFEQV